MSKYKVSHLLSVGESAYSHKWPLLNLKKALFSLYINFIHFTTRTQLVCISTVNQKDETIKVTFEKQSNHVLNTLTY